MQVIERRHKMHAFGQAGDPVAVVEPGERFLVETSLGSTVPTGPIRVAGAEPGDVLEVRVLDIALVGDGVMWARPGAGMFGEDLHDLIKETVYRKVPIKDRFGEFGDGLRVALRPMVGVVGVAPAGPELQTIRPGRHGANLDCNLIVPDAVVYLPVYRPGAGFGIGDVHARMADGEIMTSGLEIEGEITVETRLHRGPRLTGPIVELPDAVAFLASAKTLETAGLLALRRASRTIQAQTGLDFVAAGMLLSLIGELGVAQSVNILVTAKVLIRKSDLTLDILRYAV